MTPSGSEGNSSPAKTIRQPHSPLTDAQLIHYLSNISHMWGRCLNPLNLALLQWEHHYEDIAKEKIEPLGELQPSRPKLLDLFPSLKDLNSLSTSRLISERRCHLWRRPNEENLLHFGSKTVGLL